MNRLAEQLFAHPLFTAQQHRESATRRLATKVNQPPGFRVVRRHLFKGMAHFAKLAGHQLAHLLDRMQQQNKAVALLFDDWLERNYGVDKLMLALKGDFYMIQPTRVLNSPAQQGRQRHQLIDVFPLAGLGIKMQQSRGLHVKKLQNSLLIPRHHPVIHTLQ